MEQSDGEVIVWEGRTCSLRTHQSVRRHGHVRLNLELQRLTDTDTPRRPFLRVLLWSGENLVFHPFIPRPYVPDLLYVILSKKIIKTLPRGMPLVQANS